MAKKGTAAEEKLNVVIPKALLLRLKIRCVERDTTLKEAVAQAVQAWLKTA